MCRTSEVYVLHEVKTAVHFEKKKFTGMILMRGPLTHLEKERGRVEMCQKFIQKVLSYCLNFLHYLSEKIQSEFQILREGT